MIRFPHKTFYMSCSKCNSLPSPSTAVSPFTHSSQVVLTLPVIPIALKCLQADTQNISVRTFYVAEQYSEFYTNSSGRSCALLIRIEISETTVIKRCCCLFNLSYCRRSTIFSSVWNIRTPQFAILPAAVSECCLVYSPSRSWSASLNALYRCSRPTTRTVDGKAPSSLLRVGNQLFTCTFIYIICQCIFISILLIDVVWNRWLTAGWRGCPSGHRPCIHCRIHCELF